MPFSVRKRFYLEYSIFQVLMAFFYGHRGPFSKIMIKDSHLFQLKKAIDAIHPIGDDCFAMLKEIARYRMLGGNDYFSREGDFNEEFGFVIDGILRIFYLSEGGQEHNKHFLHQNSFVAASIKSDQRSITNIQALSPTKLICIKFSSFVSLMNKQRQLSDFMQKLIENYLEEKQKREIQLLSKTAEENYYIFRDNNAALYGKIPYYHIASYLGVTPTQLSRIRRKSKNINICK